MKNIHKSFLLLLFTIVIFSGCSKHPDVKYNITALTAYHQDNSGASAVDASSIKLPAKAYAIRLEYTVELYGKLDGDPNEAAFSLQNKVSSFNISSLTDYDSTHLAYASLNDYFLYGSQTSRVTNNATIDYALNQQRIGFTYNTSAANAGNPWQTSDYLVLMHPPTNLGTRMFIIKLDFANGTSISYTTSSVILN